MNRSLTTISRHLYLYHLNRPQPRSPKGNPRPQIRNQRKKYCPSKRNLKKLATVGVNRNMMAQRSRSTPFCGMCIFEHLIYLLFTCLLYLHVLFYFSPKNFLVISWKHSIFLSTKCVLCSLLRVSEKLNFSWNQNFLTEMNATVCYSDDVLLKHTFGYNLVTTLELFYKKKKRTILYLLSYSYYITESWFFI